MRTISEIEDSIRINLQYRDEDGNLPKASIDLAVDDFLEALETLFADGLDRDHDGYPDSFQTWASKLYTSAGADNDLKRQCVRALHARVRDSKKAKANAEYRAAKGITKVKPTNGKIRDMLEGGGPIDTDEDAVAVLATVLRIARRVDWTKVEKTPEIVQAVADLRKILK